MKRLVCNLNATKVMLGVKCVGRGCNPPESALGMDPGCYHVFAAMGVCASEGKAAHMLVMSWTSLLYASVSPSVTWGLTTIHAA